MTEHTPRCQGEQNAARVERFVWALRWPDFCRNCEAIGAVGVPDIDEFGEVNFDPCPACLEKGVCPRCAEDVPDPVAEDVDEPCPHCGWLVGCGMPPTFDERVDGWCTCETLDEVPF